LVAEPGAGKSTRVPLFLINQPWLAGQKILMLEPRRLAARSVARYMASLLGEEVGRTVGYRVRRESRASEGTRIEVITDGVLTRMLQRDPALEGVGCVIFDEFHERSLQADLGLALCLDVREVLREDLCILVMSATLEAESVAKLLGDAPVIRCEGRSFPVGIRYVGRAGGSPGRRAGLGGRLRRAPESGCQAGFPCGRARGRWCGSCGGRSPRRRVTSWFSCRVRGKSAASATPCGTWKAPRSGSRLCTAVCRTGRRMRRSLRARRAIEKWCLPRRSRRQVSRSRGSAWSSTRG